MEKKIGLIILLGVLSAVLMFNSLFDNKKDYLLISDGFLVTDTQNFSTMFYEENEEEFKSYNDSYVIENLSSRNLYDLINFNETIDDNEYTIKQLINASEVICISIGMSEISNNENINVYLYYMDLVLNEIRNINEYDIYLISLYYLDSSIGNVNNQLKDLCKKYNIIYVDVENITENDLQNESNYLINEEVQKLIFNTFNSTYQ